MGDNRPEVYLEDGKVIYRASSFGSCTRMLAGLRQGYEPSPTPAKMMETFERGNVAEQEAIKRSKYLITGQQREYDLEITPTICIRTHVDGLHDAEGAVVEIKSRSHQEWDKPWTGALWERYFWQFAVEILATNRPMLLILINRDDPDCEMQYHHITQPPRTLQAIRTRVLEIEKYARTGTMPNVCDREIYPCPLWRLHTQGQLVEVEDEEIDVMAREYDRCAREIRKYKAMQTAARNGLRAGITDEKIRTTSGVKVSFYQTVTKRLSEKLMMEAGVDVEKYKEEKVTEGIRVTVPENGSDETTE